MTYHAVITFSLFINLINVFPTHSIKTILHDKSTRGLNNALMINVSFLGHMPQYHFISK